MAHLKVYVAKESRDSWIPSGADDLLGERGTQGSWWVVAHTAVEAVQTAQAANLPYVASPAKLRVMSHDSVDAAKLRAAGYLVSPGEVLVKSEKVSGRGVARFFQGAWTLVGRFEYSYQAHEQIFVPEEG